MSVRTRPPQRVQIDHVLPRVLRPSRYVANERHVIRKPWTDDRVAVALSFPETYEIGMSNNGMKILYHIINRRDDALAERAYCPWPDMEAEMRRAGIPMFSHESRAPLAAFDVVGFSLAYELTYTNVLTMLDLAGIPLRAADRGDDAPIVLGGGAAMANPEPVADFFDAFLIGDGEDAIGEIIDVIRARRGGQAQGRAGSARPALLEALAAVPGVYVPEFYEVTYDPAGPTREIRPLVAGAPFPVRRRIVPSLRLDDFPATPIVPVTEIAQDRLALEVLRGCTQGCRFCQAGYFYRPVRERSPEDVLALAASGIASGGWDELSLVSLSTADHTRAAEIVRRINAAFAGRNVAISLPSLRADRFSVELAEGIREVKKTGFTFAPETGTERLRAVINKGVTNEEMIAAARAAFEKDWRLIKLYFMIGLPTETIADVQGIVALCDELVSAGKSIRRDIQVNASVGCFAPKAFTPFQWTAFAGVGPLNERLEYLKRALRNPAVKLRWHRPEDTWLEAIISRGDRRLGAVILEAWRQGARFDGWVEHASLDRWHAAFAAVGLDPEMYLRERALDEVLPWEMIDIGVSRRYLQLEWARALRGERTADCRRGGCNGCGIPGMPDDNVLSGDQEPYPVEIERAAASGRQAVCSEGASGEGKLLPGQEGFGGGLYRVRYRVGDEFTFVGHSDLMRTIHRAFKIAELPVAISQGHTPRPKASFGPPLPVGCTSEDEYFDVELDAGVSDLAERLDRAMPEGLEVTNVERVGLRANSLSSIVAAAEYRFTIPAEVLPTEAVAARLDELARADAWPVQRVTKGKERTIDLKRAIAGWRGGSANDATEVLMIVRLAEAEGNNANPTLVLAGLFGLDEEHAARVAVRRMRLLDRNGIPIGQRAWFGARSRPMHTKSFEYLRNIES